MYEIAPGRTTTSQINPETADINRLLFAAGYGVRPGRARRAMMEDANIGRGDIRLERQTTPFGATRQEAIDNLLREYFIEQVQPTLNPDAFIQNNMHGGTIIGGTPTSQYGVTVNPLNNYAGSFMDAALGAAGSYADGGYTRNQDVVNPALGATIGAVTGMPQTGTMAAAADVLANMIGRQGNLRPMTPVITAEEQVTYLPETVVTPQDGYTINRDAGVESKFLTPKQSDNLPGHLKEAIIESKMKNEGGVNKARAGMVTPPPPPTMLGTRRLQQGIQAPIEYDNPMDVSLMGTETMEANALNNSMMAGNNIPNGGMMMAADGMMKEDMKVNNAIEQYRNEMYLRNGGAVVRSRDAYSPAVPMGFGVGPSNLSESLVNTATAPVTTEQQEVLDMVLGNTLQTQTNPSKYGPIPTLTVDTVRRMNKFM
jgi:hypothetical protein